MSVLAGAILEIATTGISELFQDALAQGVIPAAVAQVGSYFKSTNMVAEYYNRSVKRSVLSLEIALKGPRAYYPQREKDFYQKHFLKFEQGVFRPFSSRAVSMGWVRTEEELRDKCIEDCNKIKRVGLRLLSTKSLNEKELQQLISKASDVDKDLSRKMLLDLEKIVACRIMPRLLEKENVLLSGIVFHFNSFLQSDPRLSNYVNYLESAEIKNSLARLEKRMKTQPDPKLGTRIRRLEKLHSSISSYQNSMGEIGKKLDNIYRKTVQTYEVLMRLERQMKSSFNAMEERLDIIQQLLVQRVATPLPSQPSPEAQAPTPTSTATTEAPETKAMEEAPPTVIIEENTQPPELPKGSLETLPLRKEARPPEPLPASIPQKHVFKVMPSRILFSEPSAAPDPPFPKDIEAITRISSTGISSIFLSATEGQTADQPQEKKIEEVSSMLDRYSSILNEAETEDVAPPGGIDALSDVFPAFISPNESKPETPSAQTGPVPDFTPEDPKPIQTSFQERSETGQPELNGEADKRKKSKRRRADKISGAFGSFD